MSIFIEPSNWQVMKAVFFVLLLVSCTHISYSQGYLGKTPSRVKRGLDQHLAKTKMSGNYEQTDTSLTLQIRDPKFQPVDFVFRFRANKCVEELRVGCDSCMRKYLDEALRVKAYGWTRVSENTYVSRRSYRRIMVLIDEPSSLLFRKINWSRKEFEATGTK